MPADRPDATNEEILGKVGQMAEAAEQSANAMEAVLALLREDRDRFDRQREAASDARTKLDQRVAALEVVVRGTGEEGRRGHSERIGAVERDAKGLRKDLTKVESLDGRVGRVEARVSSIEGRADRVPLATAVAVVAAIVSVLVAVFTR